MEFDETKASYESPIIRAYEPPVLKRWGDVSDLTQGGVASRPDGGSMTGTNEGNAPGEGGGVGGGVGGGKEHK